MQASAQQAVPPVMSLMSVIGREAPFWNVLFQYTGIAQTRKGVEAYQDGLEHFFQTLFLDIAKMS